MNNFHYQGGANKSKLHQELREIEHDIDLAKKKLQDKIKLEQEFYGDNKNINIADEVMNELLKVSDNYSKQRNANNQNFKPDSRRFDNFPHFSAQAQAPTGLVDKREMEKLKLQNRNAVDEYPFGKGSAGKERKNMISYSPPEVPRGYKKTEQQSQPVISPFLKNQMEFKLKRQQEQRNYRKLLQEQMREEKKRKEEEKQRIKQYQKLNFNHYMPVKVPIASQHHDEQVPTVPKKKKRDPNGDFPVYEKPNNEIRESDLVFYRMQLEELKMKVNRGRINYDEFERDVKKLELHYGKKAEEVLQQLPSKHNDSLNYPEQDKIIRKQEDNRPKNLSPVHIQQAGQQYIDQNHDNIDHNQNQNKHLNSRVYQQAHDDRPRSISPSNYHPYPYPPHYGNYAPQTHIQPRQSYPYPYMVKNSNPANLQNTNTSQQMQIMMLKMLEGFKQIFQIQQKSQETIIGDKKLLEQVISKFNPYLINQMSPAAFNAQILQNQQLTKQKSPLTQQNKQKEFQSAKRYERFDDLNYAPKILSNNQSQSSVSYIQKSLSGIVSKIPLNSKQKQQQDQNQSEDIQSFYNRKYKIKRFKQFQYLEPENISKKSLPSTSSYLQLQDADIKLQKLFEEDLRNYKKYEKNKQLQLIMSKLDGSEDRKHPEQSGSTEFVKQKQAKGPQARGPQAKGPQAKGPQAEHKDPNPFSKKNVSAKQQDKQALTFNKDQIQKNTPKGQILFQSPVGRNAEILQQQEYQTEPRKNLSLQAPKSPQEPRRRLRQDKNSHKLVKNDVKYTTSQKLMNIVKSNNQFFSRYDQTPSQNSISEIREKESIAISNDQSSRVYESKQFISGQDISPVKKQQYQSSLQTVRSQEQSVRADRKNNMEFLIGAVNSANRSSYSQYKSLSIKPAQQIQQGASEQRDPYYTRREFEEVGYPTNIYISQTVQSVDESQGKFPSFHKPPAYRKNRSIGRKKQGVIKMNQQSGYYKSSLYGIASQTSKQRISFTKPPQNLVHEQQSDLQQNLQVRNSATFKQDSQIYESVYQKSVNQKQNNLLYKKSGISPKTILENDQVHSPIAEIIQNPSITIQTGPKWKSLEQARRIAKQFRQKSGEDISRRSVEQKLSQFQSFIQSNKKHESQVSPKKQQYTVQMQKKKKDIMKILDDLGEEEQKYQPDFQSYQQQEGPDN